MDDPVVLGLAGALALSWVVFALWGRHRRRDLARRVGTVVTRLDGPDAYAAGRLEPTVVALEQAASHAMSVVGAAEAGAARVSGALRALPLGVVVCDELGTIVARNDVATDVGGAVVDGEVSGDQEVTRVLHAALAGGGTATTVELNGPPRRTLLVTGAPLDDGVRLVGAVAVIEDVSERRRLDAVRREFVSNVSHELKTPVGALALLADTLAAEVDTSIARRLAARMQQEAQRVARVVEDLLDLSRIEAEAAPLREPVGVHLVVAEAVERARPAAELHAVTIDVVEPSHRVTIVGDRRQLVSALFNLVENGVRYSEPGGTVSVRVRADGQWVELVVGDEGAGIPARDLERVFERFYRVDRTRGGEPGGTGGAGVGLTIVRHVAQSHRGEVRVQSVEGEGSTFLLRLPAGPGPVAVETA
jgi:two-component system sensor histidine kinase SenX3